MKLMSQIGTHTRTSKPLSARLLRQARRVKWGYVAWAIMFIVTAGIALYAVHTFAHVMNSSLAQ